MYICIYMYIMYIYVYIYIKSEYTKYSFILCIKTIDNQRKSLFRSLGEHCYNRPQIQQHGNILASCFNGSSKSLFTMFLLVQSIIWKPWCEKGSMILEFIALAKQVQHINSIFNCFQRMLKVYQYFYHYELLVRVSGLKTKKTKNKKPKYSFFFIEMGF